MILRPAVSSTILVVTLAATALLLSSQSFVIVKAAEGCLSDPEALWCDEFDVAGKPNPEYWDYDLGAGGWGNIEAQTYVEENAVVGADGLLHIQVKQDPAVNYTSSRIKTENRVSFLYVRLEASIKVPDLTGGLWPAFWLLGVNYEEIGWPMCGEIDIAEWGSANATLENRLPFTASSALHWEDDGDDEDDGGHKFDTEYIVVADNLNQDFHTYAVDWTPTSISFYLDDVEIFTKDIIGFEEFHKPFFLLLNVAVGGHYTGIYAPTSPGGVMSVDWIRAYPLVAESSVVVEPLPSSSAGGKSSLWSFSPLLSSLSIGILGLGLWTFGMV